jgi:hypothetical protein
VRLNGRHPARGASAGAGGWCWRRSHADGAVFGYQGLLFSVKRYWPPPAKPSGRFPGLFSHAPGPAPLFFNAQRPHCRRALPLAADAGHIRSCPPYPVDPAAAPEKSALGWMPPTSAELFCTSPCTAYLAFLWFGALAALGSGRTSQAALAGRRSSPSPTVFFDEWHQAHRTRSLWLVDRCRPQYRRHSVWPCGSVSGSSAASGRTAEFFQGGNAAMIFIFAHPPQLSFRQDAVGCRCNSVCMRISTAAKVNHLLALPRRGATGGRRRHGGVRREPRCCDPWRWRPSFRATRHRLLCCWCASSGSPPCRVCAVFIWPRKMARTTTLPPGAITHLPARPRCLPRACALCSLVHRSPCSAWREHHGQAACQRARYPRRGARPARCEPLRRCVGQTGCQMVN